MIKAQITVYASLTFAIVISFICTMINSVRMSVIYYETDMASRMSAESVFGGYHNECLSEFNIFVISNEQCNDNKLEYYARKNIENICQKNSVVFNKACITDLKYMTDNNGNAVKEQILNYMKYASAGEIISAFSSDGETETERGECIKDINKSIQECDIDNSFIGKQNIISAYISEINYKYQNISVCITDLKEDLLLLEEYKDEKYLEVYKYNYAILRKETDNVQQISDKIIEQIDSYNDENQDFQEKINACLEKIKSKKDILGEEVSTVMEEDLKKSTSGEDTANRLNTVRQDLLTNIRDINLINELVLKPEEIDLYSNTWEYKEKFEQVSEYAENIKIINFTAVESENSQQNKQRLNEIKSLGKKFSNGISGLVLDGITVSDASFNYEGLAQEYISGNGSRKINKQTLMYDLYIMDTFDTFPGKNRYGGLKYPVEYIICGQNSDRDNINSIILKLSAVREAVNMAYLVTNGEKRSEAFALASSIAGFTGNLLVVKAVQYIIMGIWSYAESIVDVRRLFEGDEIAVIKNDNDWKLSLKNMLAGNLKYDKADSEKNSRAERILKGRADYNDYLELLLHSVSENIKNYRTMTAMELRIINMGKTGFRMKDYIYEARIQVNVLPKADRRINAKEYIRQVKYSYIS